LRTATPNPVELAGISAVMMLSIARADLKAPPQPARRGGRKRSEFGGLTMSGITEKSSRLSRLGRWVAELLLVFVGVYAAFWLNNYQQRRQDEERRDRILASLEQELREGIESGKINRAKEERETAGFRRALDAGEMPALHPFVFTTDYSPGDFATMLQAGGIQLLDLETLIALRNDESVIRWGLSRMARYQKLSDELIAPNLDQDISFFYDPATKKLRKWFEIYPEALEATVKFANQLERTHTELLKRIQAERQYH
jgi:hypothetical protein